MTHIEQRHDTAANWEFVNPVLYVGEVGWETDTQRSKLGDGETAWNDLPYTVSDPNVTAEDVGLGDVDNTSDLDKPVSTATQTALDAKAGLNSPAFTGNPTAPTPALGDDDTSIATTAFVQAAIDAAIDAALLAAHPVGSYYASDSSTDPGTLFGGTWTRVKGKMIVGLDEADTDFDTASETGGAKTKAVPAHTHSTPNHTHTNNIALSTATGASTQNGSGAIEAARIGHTHTVSGGITSSGGGTTGAASGSDFNVMNPYVVAYIWRRTA